MASENMIITHSAGLHARPAVLFAQAAQSYSSEITVTFNGKTANAKSLLSLLSLGIVKDSEITIDANGNDESDALQALSKLIADNFGE